MLFWLKKTVSFWLMPLPFCFVLLAVGVWAWRRPKWHQRGKRLVWTSVLIFALASNERFSSALVRPLERRFPAVPELSVDAPPPAALARCRFVVVLGGGNGNGAGLPALSQLSSSALGRITEGVRLLRVLSDARLIVSGPGTDGEPTHADRLAQAATSLGVDASRIVKIETGRDTEEEAAEVRRIAGDTPVALVTSAWHMPRAATLFRLAGVDALACPTDYLLKSKPAGLSELWSWTPDSLERTTWAWHERLGQLWLWLRGKR